MNNKVFKNRKEYVAPKMTVVKVNCESILLASAKASGQGYDDGDWQSSI